MAQTSDDSNSLPLGSSRDLRSVPAHYCHSSGNLHVWDPRAKILFSGDMGAALSGGQFQRVLLARALLTQPDLLVLDEPTQGLDQPGIAAFYQLIEQVRTETGVAVLMVSHDLHVVMSASDRVICLNGHICCEGAPSVVTATPEYRALFGLGTGGALALYQHVHDHDHSADHGHGHDPDHPHQHCEGACEHV